MKENKLQKKFFKLAKLSADGEPGVCSAILKKEAVSLFGFSNTQLSADHAIVYIEKEGNKPIYYSLVQNKIIDSNITDDFMLIIDSRTKHEKKLYFRTNEFEAVFTEGISIETSLKIVAYFEVNNASTLIIGFIDPSSNNFIIEAFTGHLNSTTMCNRYILQNIVPPYIFTKPKETIANDSTQERDQYAEQY